MGTIDRKIIDRNTKFLLRLSRAVTCNGYGPAGQILAAASHLRSITSKPIVLHPSISPLWGDQTPYKSYLCHSRMSHHDVDEFDGWEVYPQNLRLSSLDVDDARIADRISRHAKELFVDKSASTFKHLELGAPNQGNSFYSVCFQTC